MKLVVKSKFVFWNYELKGKVNLKRNLLSVKDMSWLKTRTVHKWDWVVLLHNKHTDNDSNLVQYIYIYIYIYIYVCVWAKHTSLHDTFLTPNGLMRIMHNTCKLMLEPHDGNPLSLPLTSKPVLVYSLVVNLGHKHNYLLWSCKRNWLLLSCLTPCGWMRTSYLI